MPTSRKLKVGSLGLYESSSARAFREFWRTWQKKGQARICGVLLDGGVDGAGRMDDGAAKGLECGGGWTCHPVVSVCLKA